MTTSQVSQARIEKVAARRVKRRYAHNGAALLFLAPWLVGLLFLTLGPMLASLYISFTDYSPGRPELGRSG